MNREAEIKALIAEVMHRNADRWRGHRVLLFGSRVSGDARPHSDFDVSLIGVEALPLDAFFTIEDQLDDLPTPYKIDWVVSTVCPGDTESEPHNGWRSSMAEARWIVDDFSAALAQLQIALAEPDLIKAGSIQYFEFCFEFGWKVCKLVSTDQGLPDCLAPKACLRQAFALGWIEDEAVWMEMLDARNRMSHIYDACKYMKTYDPLPRCLVACNERPLANPQTVTWH